MQIDLSFEDCERIQAALRFSAIHYERAGRPKEAEADEELVDKISVEQRRLY